MTMTDKLLLAGRKRCAMGVGLGLVLLLVCVGEVVADTTGETAHRAAAGGEAGIAVVYPDIGEPYRSVFEQIIAGIEGRTRTRVANFAVRPNEDIEALKSGLQRRNVKVVIALGYQGMKIAARLDRDFGVVVGGIITPPENLLRDVPVQSLSPDPALLFSKLRELMPSARRVFAVYDPLQNGWLMRLAKQTAQEQGLELVAYEVRDLRGAVRKYQDIFAAANKRHDAVWLLQDSISAEGGTVLPLVLQEAWTRSLPVFSSNFGHVRRGALFSLYPDNAEMGRHLADMAVAFLASGEYSAHGTIFLREVLLAVNLRTADHLGLKPLRKQEIGMVFPEQ